MIDLAYIVSHGFAARMIMQTNLLGKLVDKGLKVALISPDKEDKNLKTYCENVGVELLQFNLETNSWSSRYSKSRMYFLEDINKNPALLEKHKYYTEVLNTTGIKTKLKYSGLKIIHDLKEVFPTIKNNFKKRESENLRSSEAIDFLKRIDPKVLVATYPVDYREAMLLESSNLLGIKSVLHLLSWDNISCKGYFPALADEYIVWGPIMRDELKEYYDINDSKIHVCGVPHFDVHIATRSKPNPGKHLTDLGLNKDKPYLFFGMSSPRFAPYEIDIVEHLAEKVREDVFGDDMQLIIRPHPQNIQGSMADMSWLPRLRDLNKGRVAVDFPDISVSKMSWSMQENDMLRLSELLASCIVSLNSGSTLSIDSLMCGRPVILTSFDADKKLEYWKSARRLIDYNHLKKLVSLGGVSVIKSFDEMKLEILNYLQNPDYKLKERRYTIQQQCHNHSQPATEYIVNKFLSIMN